MNTDNSAFPGWTRAARQLLPGFETLGEVLGKAGIEGLLDGGFVIVIDPADRKLLVGTVVHDITGPGVSVAGLADTSHIHQVTAVFLQLVLGLRQDAD